MVPALFAAAMSLGKSNKVNTRDMKNVNDWSASTVLHPCKKEISWKVTMNNAY